MTTYIALLRAVNVGGTGKLAMADLKQLCADLGYREIETYIASGNVVFNCSEPAERIQAKLEKRLHQHAGKAIGAFIRSADEMKRILRDNPFADKEPRLTHAWFLSEKPPQNALDDIRGRATEEIRLGRREIYVYYPAGMGQSKLKIPAAVHGTARNLNTVAKLVQISQRR